MNEQNRKLKEQQDQFESITGQLTQALRKVIEKENYSSKYVTPSCPVQFLLKWSFSYSPNNTHWLCISHYKAHQRLRKATSRCHKNSFTPPSWFAPTVSPKSRKLRLSLALISHKQRDRGTEIPRFEPKVQDTCSGSGRTDTCIAISSRKKTRPIALCAHRRARNWNAFKGAWMSAKPNGKLLVADTLDSLNILICIIAHTTSHDRTKDKRVREIGSRGTKSGLRTCYTQARVFWLRDNLSLTMDVTATASLNEPTRTTRTSSHYFETSTRVRALPTSFPTHNYSFMPMALTSKKGTQLQTRMLTHLLETVMQLIAEAGKVGNRQTDILKQKICDLNVRTRTANTVQAPVPSLFLTPLSFSYISE